MGRGLCTEARQRSTRFANAICFLLFYLLLAEIERDVERQKLEQQMAISKAEKLLPLLESSEMKKAKKKMKKEIKKFKKREKREKERNRRSPTPIEERGTADDEGSWDKHKKKQVDYRKLKVTILFPFQSCCI